MSKDFAFALAAMTGENSSEDVVMTDSSNSQGAKGSLNDPVGSWTAFNKEATSVETSKSRNEYLPTVSHPPDDKICKYYLD